ncbi:Growth arrest-specific protein [Actinidia chinensis var. chinensis]|uniref:Growth arrest-specific protein n=1 Tax=Actinidia chinensis var. chinensis TaxID=1590841 RepID=A0A2R6PXY8_ACTCC|nr:Growth arrest-specific protein [Actinidia chinensis var. chinensis]
MAILCLCENNKENIQHLSKQASKIEAMSKIPAKRRRRARHPLEDITNFFHPPPPPPTQSTPISNTTELFVSHRKLVHNPVQRKRRVENVPGFSIQMNVARVPEEGF